jgi:hypothetical protein
MLDDVPMELALVGAGGVGREALDAVMAGGNAVSSMIGSLARRFRPARRTAC